MKILFADKFPQSYLEQLKDQGHDCTVQAELTADDLPAEGGAIFNRINRIRCLS